MNIGILVDVDKTNIQVYVLQREQLKMYKLNNVKINFNDEIIITPINLLIECLTITKMIISISVFINIIHRVKTVRSHNNFFRCINDFCHF